MARATTPAIVGLILLTSGASGGAPTGGAHPGLASPVPLDAPREPAIRFEQNLGQFDSTVLFLARGRGHFVYLTRSEAVVVPAATDARSPRPPELRLKLLGANTEPEILGVDELPGVSHYLLGDDPAAWVRGARHYSRVLLRGIYPGIDLVYHEHEGELEYDFVLSPGTAPDAIRIGVSGADSVELDDEGNLVLSTASGEVVHRAPLLRQDVDGIRHTIAGRFVLHGADQFGFEAGEYDPAHRLVIDPVLSYSSYLGGSAFDGPTGMAVDRAGNVYLGGVTNSSNFPLANPVQPSPGGSGEAFIVKLDPSATTLLYSTFLGGEGEDRVFDLAADGEGYVYVAGDTGSTSFPTVDPLQPEFAGGVRDVFIAKLDPSGSTLLYSTYLGGSGFDANPFIAVDPEGYACVGGHTWSTDFPTHEALQPEPPGGPPGAAETFVARITPTGSAVVYSTYLGGNHQDFGWSIAADAAGNAYVAGSTYSTDFPTVQPYQGTKAGSNDAFIAKLDPAGTSLVYSTYLGGINDDFPEKIVVDASGRAYLVGHTYSADFPTVRPVQGANSGMNDGFLTTLVPAGSALSFSTYLGGSAHDNIRSVALGTSGLVYVAGHTDSVDLPTARPVQSASAGDWDGFLARINPSESTLDFSTYLGGSLDESVSAVAVDPAGSVYVAGNTQSVDFPTSGDAFQSQLAGNRDVFLTRFTWPMRLFIASGSSSPRRPRPSYALPSNRRAPDGRRDP